MTKIFTGERVGKAGRLAVGAKYGRLLLFALAIPLAACGSRPAPSTTPTNSPTAASIAMPALWVIPHVLDGTIWTLVELNGQAPLARTIITLAFAQDKVSGYAGCNWYKGPYPSGPDPAKGVAFEITVRGCSEPAGIEQQENAYIDALQHAASRIRTTDRLEFFDAAGKLTLVFQ